MKKFNIAILLICSIMSASLMAEILLYDSFEYPAGPLNTRNGGTGWSGAWATTTYNVVESSLAMPNLLFTPKGGSAVGKGDINRLFSGIDFSQDGVYYISYLCRRTGWTSATSGEWGEVVLRTSDFLYVATWGVSSAEYFNTTSLGSTKSLAGGDINDVVFMVGKVITRATGNDEIFLIPYLAADTIPTVEPQSWKISGGNEAENSLAGRFTVRAGSAAGYQFEIDEIRLGTQWADVVAPPSANTVVYLTPVQGQETVSPLTFTWQAPSAVESPTYKLYFSTVYGEVDPNDTTPDIAPVTLTDTSYGPALLDMNAQYYWRVDYIDGQTVKAGKIASFSTIPPISPVAPAAGAVNQPRNVVLSWDSQIALSGNYQVYVGLSPEVLDYAGDSTGTSFAPDFLDWGVKYYWKVVHQNSGSPIESSVWDFTVAAGPVCDGTLIGDLDDNCITDTADLALMALEWLDCTITNDNDCL